MADQKNGSKLELMTPEQACERVAEVYHGGSNCDKAILQVLQQILAFPEERWNFNMFHSENPDYEPFLCKALLAGAMGIYLDVLNRDDQSPSQQDESCEESIQRIISLFNRMLEEMSGPQAKRVQEVDPFAFDAPALRTISDPEWAKREYQRRVAELVDAFVGRFGEWDCQALLGFNPFNYLNYDEETQAYIEQGEWMEKCCKYVKMVVRQLHQDKNR